MFERFTDRARRAIVLAQDEARALGHAQIRPEHLGLGLVQSDGVSGQVLREFGVTYEGTRERIVAVTPAGEAPAVAGERLPFTPEAKQVLEKSLREALRLGHKYIGTEHLLLGLLRSYEQLAADLFPVNLGLLRTRVVQYATGGPGERVTRSPALRAALGRAQGAAGDEPITTGHVLVALAGDPDSQGGKALAQLDVSEGALADALREIPVEDTSDASGPPRWFEIRLGGRIETFRDPELAKRLADCAPEQIRELLRKGVERKDPD
jgi:ATP-dependent Clp protease ATP-binding subunit ClpA